MSGWVHQQNGIGSVPVITSSVVSAVLQRPLPPVSERAMALLQEGERGQNVLGAAFNINESRFVSATFSSDQDDVGFLAMALMDDGLIKSQGTGGLFSITPKGHMKLDENRRRSSRSSQGFVAMWFDESLNKTYADGFQLGILNSGYDPLRIDC